MISLDALETGCERYNWSGGGIAKTSRLTGVVVGCKDGKVFALVGQRGQELAAGPGGIDKADCRSETSKACAVQGLQQARQVGGVLGIGHSGESQDDDREEGNHVSGRGEEDREP